MSFFVNPQGLKTATVPAGGSIAVYSQGLAVVNRVYSSPNAPSTAEQIGTVNNAHVVFGPFTAATTVQIECMGSALAWYDIGVSPAVAQNRLNWQVQPTPGTLNATGTLSFSLIGSGIVTSTTAAAVTATLPTGAVMDAATSFDIGDSVDFTVINTGGTNAFTVAGASGHTLVGAAAVAALTSGRFRTTKTAAATFVTYRIS